MDISYLVTFCQILNPTNIHLKSLIDDPAFGVSGCCGPFFLSQVELIKYSVPQFTLLLLKYSQTGGGYRFHHRHQAKENNAGPAFIYM